MNPENVEVLILVGGKGTRLQAVVSDVPKPMAPIQNKPFLEYLIKNLKSQRFQNIALLTGYMAPKISDHFGSGQEFGVKVRYSHEESPLGTGGAIKKAINSSDFKEFLILNGDTYFDIPFGEIVLPEGAEISMVVCHMDDLSRYGQVLTDGEGRLTGFAEKSLIPSSGQINAGVSFARKSLTHWIPEDRVSFESVILPHLIAQKLVVIQPFCATFIDIGIPSDFQRAQTLIPSLSR